MRNLRVTVSLVVRTDLRKNDPRTRSGADFVGEFPAETREQPGFEGRSSDLKKNQPDNKGRQNESSGPREDRFPANVEFYARRKRDGIENLS